MEKHTFQQQFNAQFLPFVRSAICKINLFTTAYQMVFYKFLKHSERMSFYLFFLWFFPVPFWEEPSVTFVLNFVFGTNYYLLLAAPHFKSLSSPLPVSSCSHPLSLLSLLSPYLLCIV